MTFVRPPARHPPPVRRQRETEPFLTSLGRIYRVLRIVLLGALTFVLTLILLPDRAPPVLESADAPATLEKKLDAVDQELAHGRPAELRVNEAELNAWMSSNLALAPPPTAPASTTPSEPTIEQVQSNVRDVKVQIDGDRIRGYVLFDLYGKDMTITLEGYLSVRDGFIRLDPTGMKVGSMPIPRPTIERAVKQLFESPENREQFRVPPNIRDIRVEGGVLVVAF